MATFVQVAERVAQSIETWIQTGWRDLASFVALLVRHPPTPAAVSLVIAAIASIWLLALLLSKLAPKREKPPEYPISGYGSDDRVVRLTLEQVTNLKVEVNRLVVIHCPKTKKKVTAKVELRRPSRRKPPQALIASDAVFSALDIVGQDAKENISIDEPIGLDIRKLPIYNARRWIDQSIFATDQNARLAWRICLISFFLSWLLTYCYFELAKPG